MTPPNSTTRAPGTGGAARANAASPDTAYTDSGRTEPAYADPAHTGSARAEPPYAGPASPGMAHPHPPVAPADSERPDGAHTDPVLAAPAPYPDRSGPALALVRRELRRRWPDGAAGVAGIARHALLPAGKLLRPLLLIESAGAVGGGADEVVAAALGVEYLHVGSLIHDDVIDGDELRRGRPTVAARFGTADAIVAGDALILGMFQAVTECADHGVPAHRLLAAVRALADAGVDLCRGQALEAELRGDAGCGLDRYLTMIALKTGALFRGACRSGALLGGGSVEQQTALTEYAEHLGLAFQMSDDLLPYTSDTATSGKSVLSDVSNGRPTLPVLLAHDAAGPRGRGRLAAALSGDLPVPEALETVREQLASTGALDAARERIRSETALARRCLTVLPPSPSRDVLATVAELSAERER